MPSLPRSVLLLATCMASVAQAGELAPEETALFLLRTLAYDRALMARTEAELPVLVVHRSGDPQSAEPSSRLFRRRRFGRSSTRCFSVSTDMTATSKKTRLPR